MWETGSILAELGWTIMVLISKVNADTWGIGLIEVVWKVVGEVIDNHIKSVVQFYNVLHGFYAGRGTGTAIMELKLAQQLASVDQDPLFLVFIELQKT